VTGPVTKGLATERPSRAPVLVSVNVGMPKDVPWHGKTVHTGVWKHQVAGPQMVRRLNIDGDGQGDLNGHGGQQRAVLVYQIDSYRYWQQQFGRDDFTYGMFGENLTVDGLPDDEVCIGDRYRIGEAEFEVTQPRVTCYRVGMRLGKPEMAALLVSHHRPGFYLRVITEGHIQGGDPIIKTRTGPGALSVADTDALLYLPDPDRAKLRAALEIPALSPGWQGSFRDLLASAQGAGEASPFGAETNPSPKPTWTAFRKLRVTRIVTESENVCSIYLAAPDGTALPTARPGQYLTLRVSGAGDPPPVRSYSLSWTAGAGTYRISVKREPHGVVSGYLNRSLQPGAVLDVAAPRGDFVLSDGAGPVLLISAGIGVTPVLSMLYKLAKQHSEREVWWLHGARGPREHPFAAEVHSLLASLPHAHEHVFYSAATAAERESVHAVDGRLTSKALAGLAVPPDGGAYVCGPTSFMADMQEALTTAGVAPPAIHTELFGTLPAVTPGISGQASRPPHQPPGPPGTGPRVAFARSGITVPFGDDWANVLDLADACDVPTRWSCRTGVCHTCISTLVSGGITYNPDPLEPPPDGNVLICCARPDTDIVLDL
jgi:ferredoxin-NADP reductase/MOSC domain-containing protein YiiM/ferredoxin